MTGAVIERHDCDDYGTVTLLTSDGIPTSATPAEGTGSAREQRNRKTFRSQAAGALRGPEAQEAGCGMRS